MGPLIKKEKREKIRSTRVAVDLHQLFLINASSSTPTALSNLHRLKMEGAYVQQEFLFE